jgi:hypothetical protein
MTEDTQTTDTESVVTEPSLDDVINEYKPQPVAAAPVAHAAPVQVVSAPAVDPLDETSMNNYVQSVNTGQSVLSNQLQDVQTELTQLRENSAKLQIEADINDAVTRLTDGLDVNPKLARIHLEYTAQEKPGFKAIWDNRAQEPAAYQAALKALSREISDTYSVKTDPDLLASQVAIQKSQQSRSTTNDKAGSGSALEDRLEEAKSGGEFNAQWQRLVSG